MENKKEIGNAFKDKLNLLDKSPKEAVWEIIKHDLQKKKKRRAILIPFWVTCASIFTFAIFLTSYLYQDTVNETLNIHSIKLDSDKRISPIQKTDSENTLNKIALDNKDTLSIKNGTFLNINSKDSKATKTIFVNNKIINSTHKRKKFFKEISANTSSKKLSLSRNIKKSKAKKKNIFNNPQILKDSIESTQFPKKDKSKPIIDKTTSTSEKYMLLTGIEFVKTDSLNQNKKKKRLLTKEPIKAKDMDSLDIIEKKDVNIFVYGSPTYSGMFSKESHIDKTLDNNITSEITFSYGVYLTHKIDQKWSFRFGIAKNNMKLITKNAVINTTNYYNINYTKGISNLDIYNKSEVSKLINIIQDISYIEIPLEAKYNITNAKFGIEIFGGLSYMHLNQNNVSFETTSNMFLIGKTKELSDNTYSLNMGLNLNYKISNKLNFNIEPVFKYHLIDYKNNEKTNPYTIGIQTGLEFFIFNFK